MVRVVCSRYCDCPVAERSVCVRRSKPRTPLELDAGPVNLQRTRPLFASVNGNFLCGNVTSVSICWTRRTRYQTRSGVDPWRSQPSSGPPTAQIVPPDDPTHPLRFSIEKESRLHLWRGPEPAGTFARGRISFPSSRSISCCPATASPADVSGRCLSLSVSGRQGGRARGSRPPRPRRSRRFKFVSRRDRPSPVQQHSSGLVPMVGGVGLHDSEGVPAEMQEFLVEQFGETVDGCGIIAPARRTWDWVLAVASAARSVAYSSEAASEATASRSRNNAK